VNGKLSRAGRWRAVGGADDILQMSKIRVKECIQTDQQK
jgi:hypothetical protein